MRDSVSEFIAVDPQRVWEFVSDITTTSQYSQETFDARWMGGATGPAVGVRFKGHVKRNGVGPTYWSVCTITDCEPGRSFAFSVAAGSMSVITWRYEFAPETRDGHDGTRVTESFELEPSFAMRLYWLVLGWSRGKTNRRNMAATLAKIKELIEAS